MELFKSTVYHFILPIAHFIFKLYISLWTYSLPSSHSHLYSILLTLLYILPLLTQLGCVCLPRFWLFCLFAYLWFGFLVLLFVCVLCVLVFSLLLVFFCFARTARLSQYSHISLLANKEIRRQHLSRLDPKSTKSTIIQMQKNTANNL